MFDEGLIDGDLAMTKHARARSFARHLPESSVLAALAHGREVHTRGAVLFVIGKKEVANARKYGEDISRSEGVHVVCTREDHILTVYRNHDLRGLRPTRRTRTVRFRITAGRNPPAFSREVYMRSHWFSTYCLARCLTVSSSFGKNIAVVIAATVIPILIGVMGSRLVKWILLYLVLVGFLVYFKRKHRLLPSQRVVTVKARHRR